MAKQHGVPSAQNFEGLHDKPMLMAKICQEEVSNLIFKPVRTVTRTTLHTSGTISWTGTIICSLHGQHASIHVISTPSAPTGHGGRGHQGDHASSKQATAVERPTSPDMSLVQRTAICDTMMQPLARGIQQHHSQMLGGSALSSIQISQMRTTV